MCNIKHILLAQEEVDELAQGQGRPVEPDKEG